MRFMARAALGKWRVASKCVHFSGLRSTTRFTCVKVDGKRERERERENEIVDRRHRKLQMSSSFFKFFMANMTRG